MVDRKSFHVLFLPLLASGIVISTVGTILKFLGEMVGPDGEGFSIIGLRLVIGGACTIIISFMLSTITRFQNHYSYSNLFL